VTEAYYDVGDKQRAGEISARLFQIMDENLSYYMTLDPAMADKISQEMEITHAVMGRLVQNVERNDPANPELARLKARMEEVNTAYGALLESIETAGRRNLRMTF
jgi:hypothetical protein